MIHGRSVPGRYIVWKILGPDVMGNQHTALPLSRGKIRSFIPVMLSAGPV